MEEKWTKASDFPMYEVSNEGRIRNAKTGRIMKTRINDKGYESLTLVKNNSKHTVALHRIIAKSFYDVRYEGLDVNHIDGNKLNNRIENLEFCTRKENVQHALRTGLRTNNDYGRHGVKIRCLETGEIFNSFNECERRIGVDHSELSKYLSGKINRPPKGYHFERIE